MVHEVRVEGGQARLVVSTGQTPRLIAPSQPLAVMQIRSFVESVRIAGGTGPYTTAGTLPEGISLSATGDELLVTGSVVEVGPYDLTMSVSDAFGRTSEEISVTLTAPTEWTVVVADLLQSLPASDTDPLTPGELDYLDSIGNQNGAYDVGDLRKFLREQMPTSN